MIVTENMKLCKVNFSYLARLNYLAGIMLFLLRIDTEMCLCNSVFYPVSVEIINF